jgi:hypothetical protein
MDTSPEMIFRYRRLDFKLTQSRKRPGVVAFYSPRPINEQSPEVIAQALKSPVRIALGVKLSRVWGIRSYMPLREL